ncbi:hypothetical protein EIP86_010477 [Pleurotus ostreatoroseus]|nr:hypothetical protein EIP86_010477 [Pleurotus ostreatoroseus]
MGVTQSGPKVTKQDRAILEFLQRDKVKQYQKKIQAVLDREQEIAKEQLKAGNKDKALLALRRRKYQESLLEKTDSQLENLENLVCHFAVFTASCNSKRISAQVSTIEFSLVEVSVLHGLQQGNEVLKQIHKEMNLESVEKILEETAEAREYQREIDEMLGSTLTAEDEEEVEKELLQLQKEAGAVQEEAPERPIILPSAPTTEPKVEEPEQEEAEEVPESRERVPVLA